MAQMTVSTTIGETTSNMALEATSIYDYEQLDLTKQQIRLIALHPSANPEDPIKCDIRTFDAETGPHYVALSYTWGPVSPQQTILVNGRRLSIRQNLFDFLQRYRNDLSNVHYLWVDQICISQAHAGERNHQVGLMSQIYSRSLSTTIWLGENLAAQRYQKSRNRDDLCILFRNPYFHRLWVIQEIFLSQHKRVLCGETWLDLDDLVGELQDSSCRRLPPVDFMGFMLLGHAGSNLALLQRGRASLNYCITRFAGYDCEDPRDKVYGLLSLVHENDRPGIDYDRSTEGVFLQAVKAEWGNTGIQLEDHQLEYLLNLSDVMGLHEHQAVLRALFDRMQGTCRNPMDSNIQETVVGFQPRTHQTRADCQNLSCPRDGCCYDRWWFLWGAVRYYCHTVNGSAKWSIDDMYDINYWAAAQENKMWAASQKNTISLNVRTSHREF